MALVSLFLFGSALLIAVAAIHLTLAPRWQRIKAIAAMRGEPDVRVIRAGPVRYTGQRLRLAVVNQFDEEGEQTRFAFGDRRAA